jgi:ABC-2 type transport system permease protein
MRYLKLFTVFLRLSALNELQYRVNFFMEFLNSAIALGTGLAALGLVFYHTGSLKGWSAAELLIVTGVYTFLTGAVNVFVQPSMWRLMESIQEGTFDYVATKPADAQFTSSLIDIQIWKSVDLILGLVVIGIGMARLDASVSLLEGLAFALTLVAGGVMVYSLWLILTTTAFWFVRIWSLLDMFQQVTQTGRYPVGIYPQWLRIILTFLVPVAFAITVPSSALTGRLDGLTLATALGVALAMFVAARLFWRFGLRHYSGASA